MTNENSSLVRMDTYEVNSLETEELPVSGKGDSKFWLNAHELVDFVYPWETEPAPRTMFKALHNTDKVYFLFRVWDKQIRFYRQSDKKIEVTYSDRVEIFFRKDENLAPYFCLEMDAYARVFDYEANLYRKFNADWSWPKDQLLIKSNLTDEGYTVEISITKQSLRQLGVLNGNRIEAGLFRGQCTKLNEDNPDMKWISWIRPSSVTPDFHIPSAFGVLELKEGR